MKDRNPELAALLSRISPTGKNPEEAAKLELCTQCAGPAKIFKDLISKKEYEITGSCQECQDKFFAEFSKNEDEEIMNKISNK